MKQLLQNLRDGTTEVAEVPAPRAGPGEVLIRTRRSLVSAGTERMLVEFGRAGLIAKARQQPDKVRQVVDKVRTDGLIPTLEAVRAKLDQPLPLGYSSVGTVIEVGSGVSGLAPGDRVASNGRHAEIVCVPQNLCAKVPDAVGDEAAAFTVVGAIALQGIRLAAPTLGESVVVTGLGLIGLLTVQLLRSHGARVLGIDFDASRRALAEALGAQTIDAGTGDPVAAAEAFSRGRGVDAVIVTAATRSSEPMRQAARMCRKRGRVVLVGVAGLELSRADFYEKELTLQVSCSYGPGRYDPSYEEGGQDYPVGFVRWTAQRNFEAVLDMMADGRLDVGPLITHRFAIADAAKAYDVVGGAEPSLGILLEYPALDAAQTQETLARSLRVIGRAQAPEGKGAAVGVIGAGSYATQVLLPALKAAGADIRCIASRQGVSALHAARKFNIATTTTEAARIMADPDIGAVVIATRHNTHARFVVDALEAGKAAFVEKPLCLTPDELGKIEAAYAKASEAGAIPLLMVGFNRRFAPHVAKARTLLASVPGPKAMVLTVNAGAVPPDHWTQEPSAGGGRIVGEACHFIDLLRHLAGAPIAESSATFLRSAAGDTASLSLTFADGSIGTVHYLANGSRSFPKERLEIFAGGRILQLDNFRRMTGFGWPGFRSARLWRQDKGQRACVAAFLQALRGGGPAPIAFSELCEVSRVAIELARQRT